MWLLSLVLILGCAASTPPARGQHIPDLPEGAYVLEEASLASRGYPDRALLLWMIHPARHPTEYEPDEPYTCPEETRGSHYSGPARASLVDTARGRILQTIEIRDPHFDGQDTLDLPYQIRPGRYYHTGPAAGGIEVKPTILWLRDYNGDGEALEFALFDAPACMGLQTTLIGYIPEEDRVLQYPIRLDVTRQGRTSPETWYWIDYLLSEKPESPGRWKYEIDYRGRGGTLNRYAVDYDRETRQFQGTLVLTDAE